MCTSWNNTLINKDFSLSVPLVKMNCQRSSQANHAITLHYRKHVGRSQCQSGRDLQMPLEVGGSGLHEDVIKWKHFPRYWPFVRGIHRSPANSPHKGQWRGALMFSISDYQAGIYCIFSTYPKHLSYIIHWFIQLYHLWNFWRNDSSIFRWLLVCRL